MGKEKGEMSLLYGAFGLYIGIAHPALFWPIAILLLLLDLGEKKPAGE